MNRKITVALLTLLKGLMLPIAVGLLVTIIHYPLGMADCHFYGSARGIDTKYVWFQCYVKSDKMGWVTKEEYERAVMGSKVILSHE